MPRAALRVIESPIFRKEVELWTEESAKSNHSLHGVIASLEACRPELPRYFLERYSKKGDVVLDPFCGSGTLSLEVLLLGRTPVSSDYNPLSVRVTTAKLSPVDLTEITLRLQAINLRRPVSLEMFHSSFAPFYDLGTFREIVNLRHSLHQHYDRVARFIELIVLGLLHGHTAGYLSNYTYPHLSLQPEEQEILNARRKSVPEHRALVPRVLRRAASTLRDATTGLYRTLPQCSVPFLTDARNLSFLGSSSVDLVLTSPPVLQKRNSVADNWLRLWCAGIPTKTIPRSTFGTTEEWSDFMNEVLLELARVVRSGGRAIFDLREVKVGSENVKLDDELSKVVSEGLSRYWEVEGVIVQKQRFAHLKDSLKPRDDKNETRHRVLIVRRK